jgi:hypothetical protein
VITITTNPQSIEAQAVQALIAELPTAAQKRVAIVADILRDLLEKDVSGESMLAFTLVLAEVSQ